MAIESDAELLTTREVADTLRVSTATVLRRYDTGDLPGVKLGPRTIRFRKADVDALLAPPEAIEA